jgi:hypothetical protein
LLDTDKSSRCRRVHLVLPLVFRGGAYAIVPLLSYLLLVRGGSNSARRSFRMRCQVIVCTWGSSRREGKRGRVAAGTTFLGRSTKFRTSVQRASPWDEHTERRTSANSVPPTPTLAVCSSHALVPRSWNRSTSRAHHQVVIIAARDCCHFQKGAEIVPWEQSQQSCYRVPKLDYFHRRLRDILRANDTRPMARTHGTLQAVRVCRSYLDP